ELRLDALRTPGPRRTVSTRSRGEHCGLAGAGQPEKSPASVNGRGSAERTGAVEESCDRRPKSALRSTLELARALRPMGTMHHARRAVVDDAQRVQQRSSDRADVQLRPVSLRDDS